MNLINDAWIPARRKSGIKEKIAPWQVTDRYEEDPFIELAAVRPDFNGALIQFLIGLLQTTCAPQGNSDWRKWLNNPPNEAELKNKFKDVADVFNLDIGDSRFMQDLKLDNEEKKTTEDIEKLLIDAPGDKTIKENKDMFIKRARIKKMCLHCCAQALLTLQINAPEGGKGHWAGLRGGGPVNTIVLGDNLWQTIWNNVLSVAEFIVLADKKANNIYPWLSETKISKAKTTYDEKGKKKKTYTNTADSQNINPAQIYWSMPRRIRLIVSDKTGQCDLCQKKGNMVYEYLAKPYGTKYIGLRYPLTPIYKKDNEILSKHFQKGDSIGYRHWLGFVQNDSKNQSEPALVITESFKRRIDNMRIWAFGYDMDSMKSRGYYEGVMPVIFIDDEEKWKKYCAYVAMIINAAAEVQKNLSYYIAESMKDRQKQRSIKKYLEKVSIRTGQRFWQETESEFYGQLEKLRQDVLNNGEGIAVRQAWYKYLKGKAGCIFNDMSQAEMIDMVNAERVAKAYNELRKNLDSRKLKTEILGLPLRGGGYERL